MLHTICKCSIFSISSILCTVCSRLNKRFLKLKTFVRCFTFLVRTHKADTPSEGQPTFCKKHCMVQTARNLLHLADIEQQKLGKRLACFTGFSTAFGV